MGKNKQQFLDFHQVLSRKRKKDKNTHQLFPFTSSLHHFKRHCQVILLVVKQLHLYFFRDSLQRSRTCCIASFSVYLGLNFGGPLHFETGLHLTTTTESVYGIQRYLTCLFSESNFLQRLQRERDNINLRCHHQPIRQRQLKENTNRFMKKK